MIAALEAASDPVKLITADAGALLPAFAGVTFDLLPYDHVELQRVRSMDPLTIELPDAAALAAAGAKLARVKEQHATLIAKRGRSGGKLGLEDVGALRALTKAIGSPELHGLLVAARKRFEIDRRALCLVGCVNWKGVTNYHGGERGCTIEDRCLMFGLDGYLLHRRDRAHQPRFLTHQEGEALLSSCDQDMGLTCFLGGPRGPWAEGGELGPLLTFKGQRWGDVLAKWLIRQSKAGRRQPDLLDAVLESGLEAIN